MFAATLVLVSLLPAAPLPINPMQDTTWVGKTVLLKRTGISIHRIDETGAEVPVAELTELDYRVLGERGDRVQVKARNGATGWVRKSEVVPLADAPAHFTERLQQNPNDSDLFNRRAWAWKLKGEYDIAIKDFGEAIRLNPDAAIYNNRASAYLAKKDYDKAIDDYTEAIRLNPNFALPFYNRAILWETKKDYDKAIDDYTDAIRLDPKYVNAFRNRGYMRHLKKEFDKAIEDYSEAIRLDPKSTDAYQDRGNSWHEKKDFDKAIADFSEALRIDPKYFYATYSRGRAHEAKRDFDKAVEDYSETIRHNPKYMFAYWGRASARNQMKQFDKSAADYTEALRLDPRNSRLLNSLSWMLATCPDEKVRDGKRAVELGKQAQELDKKNANVMDTLAAAYAEAGDFDEAVRWQEQALQDPTAKNNAGYRERLELYRKKMPYRQP